MKFREYLKRLWLERIKCITMQEDKSISCTCCNSTRTELVRNVSGVDHHNNDVDLVAYTCKDCQQEFTDF
jgi:hypothetical protein